MARQFASIAVTLSVAVVASTLASQSADAQQPRTTTRLIPLSALVAAGFEVKAATGNQSGVVGSLVLQKDKDVYLCDAKDLSVQPTAFECWPVK